MICQNCKKNEATFYYRSNINGKVTEQHLCDGCASQMKYDGWLGRNEEDLLNSVFSQIVRGWIMIPALATSREMSGGMGNILGPRASDEAQEAFIGQDDSKKNTAYTVPDDIGRKLKAKREIQLLHNQLQTAVDAQEYERAAVLRDQIKEREDRELDITAEK